MTTRIDRTVGNDFLAVEDTSDENYFTSMGVLGGFFSVTVGKGGTDTSVLIDLDDAETMLTEMVAVVQARRAERERWNRLTLEDKLGTLS